MLRMKITFIYLCLYALWSMAWVYKLGFTRNMIGGVSGYVLLTISYAAMMYFNVFEQRRDTSRSGETTQRASKVVDKK